MNEMERLVVFVEKGTKRALRHEAADRGCGLSGVVRVALSEWLGGRAKAVEGSAEYVEGLLHAQDGGKADENQEQKDERGGQPLEDKHAKIEAIIHGQKVPRETKELSVTGLGAPWGNVEPEEIRFKPECPTCTTPLVEAQERGKIVMRCPRCV